MLPLIPAPFSARPAGDAQALALRDGDAIAAPPELARVAERFAADLAAGGGPKLRVSDADGVVRLEFGTGGFDELPPTGGVSPSGTDPADERHGLEVAGGVVRVWATAPEGFTRALTTLRQLVDEGGALPGVRIVDAPRFAWRGLSLDVVRTFFGVEEVKAVIDLLASYKLNVLHLHLTDDQGWRLELASRPRLTEVASSGALGDRPGGFYTAGQYRDLVAYAAERFVTVVPEFDFPGHCAAVFRAYPELAPEGWEPGAGPGFAAALDPDRDATWAFLRDVFTELAALTPGAFLHVGGDEAALTGDGYDRFVAGVRDIAASVGKRVVGWQEYARAGLAPGDIAQHWISGMQLDPDNMPDLGGIGELYGLTQEQLRDMLPMIAEMFGKAEGDVSRAVADGAAVLLSPSSKVYLDQPHLDPCPPGQEAERARLGLRGYAGLTLESAMEGDPVQWHDALEESAIAGVEAAVWCETVTSFEDLGFLLLPRLAGVAEKAWSPQGRYAWDEYSGRLAEHSPAWRRAGWNFFRATTVPWR